MLCYMTLLHLMFMQIISTFPRSSIDNFQIITVSAHEILTERISNMYYNLSYISVLNCPTSVYTLTNPYMCIYVQRHSHAHHDVHIPPIVTGQRASSTQTLGRGRGRGGRGACQGHRASSSEVLRVLLPFLSAASFAAGNYLLRITTIIRGGTVLCAAGVSCVNDDHDCQFGDDHQY